MHSAGLRKQLQKAKTKISFETWKQQNLPNTLPHFQTLESHNGIPPNERYTIRKTAPRDKKLDNTLIYTQLVDFEDDEFTCKIAKTVQEATQLIEAGFEFVTVIDDCRLFRKRK